MSSYRTYKGDLSHSWGPWKKHIYIAKNGDDYIYPDNYRDNLKSSKSNTRVIGGKNTRSSTETGSSSSSSSNKSSREKALAVLNNYKEKSKNLKGSSVADDGGGSSSSSKGSKGSSSGKAKKSDEEKAAEKAAKEAAKAEKAAQRESAKAEKTAQREAAAKAREEEKNKKEKAKKDKEDIVEKFKEEIESSGNSAQRIFDSNSFDDLLKKFGIEDGDSSALRKVLMQKYHITNTSDQEKNLFKSISDHLEKANISADDFYKDNKFDYILKSYGGYDPVTMTEATKDQLKKRFMEYFNVTGGIVKTTKKTVKNKMHAKARVGKSLAHCAMRVGPIDDGIPIVDERTKRNNMYVFYSGSLSHAKTSKSRYKGGFKVLNGRMNNTSAYNHDYYVSNRDKWNNTVKKKREKKYSKLADWFGVDEKDRLDENSRKIQDEEQFRDWLYNPWKYDDDAEWWEKDKYQPNYKEIDRDWGESWNTQNDLEREGQKLSNAYRNTPMGKIQSFYEEVDYQLWSIGDDIKSLFKK